MRNRRRLYSQHTLVYQSRRFSTKPWTFTRQSKFLDLWQWSESLVFETWECSRCCWPIITTWRYLYRIQNLFIASKEAVSFSATTESVGSSSASMVSSANWYADEVHCRGRFLTKMLNRRGLRPKPWGKPLEIRDLFIGSGYCMQCSQYWRSCRSSWTQSLANRQWPAVVDHFW